jgi:hypothetical protein
VCLRGYIALSLQFSSTGGIMSLLWKSLLINSKDTPEEEPATQLLLSVSIKKINEIEKHILSALDSLHQPDYINDFIRDGGLIGVESSGFSNVEAFPEKKF